MTPQEAARTAGLVMQDARLKTGRTGVKWRPAWRWPNPPVGNLEGKA